MNLIKPTNVKPETEIVAFRAPRTLIKQFELQCADAGVNISEGMRQLIVQFLDAKESGE